MRGFIQRDDIVGSRRRGANVGQLCAGLLVAPANQIASIGRLVGQLDQLRSSVLRRVHRVTVVHVHRAAVRLVVHVCRLLSRIAALRLVRLRLALHHSRRARHRVHVLVGGGGGRDARQFARRVAHVPGDARRRHRWHRRQLDDLAQGILRVLHSCAGIAGGAAAAVAAVLQLDQVADGVQLGQLAVDVERAEQQAARDELHLPRDVVGRHMQLLLQQQLQLLLRVLLQQQQLQTLVLQRVARQVAGALHPAQRLLQRHLLLEEGDRLLAVRAVQVLQHVALLATYRGDRVDRHVTDVLFHLLHVALTFVDHAQLRAHVRDALLAERYESVERLALLRRALVQRRHVVRAMLVKRAQHADARLALLAVEAHHLVGVHLARDVLLGADVEQVVRLRDARAPVQLHASPAQVLVALETLQQRLAVRRSARRLADLADGRRRLPLVDDLREAGDEEVVGQAPDAARRHVGLAPTDGTGDGAGVQQVAVRPLGLRLQVLLQAAGAESVQADQRLRLVVQLEADLADEKLVVYLVHQLHSVRHICAAVGVDLCTDGAVFVRV